jgi:polyphosphate kinase
MDVESINRWEDYSRAKDEMMLHTDTPTNRWFVVESDIKKHARLNMIAHLLSSIPYTEVAAPDVELPKRLTSTANYQRPPRDQFSYVPDHAATILGDPEANS